MYARCKEMTGRAMFNEVFLTDARVGDDAMIGGKNNGWAVANTTLMFERAGLGSGGGNSAASAATPGTVAGDLDKRVGDFVGARRSGGGGGFGGMSTMLIEMAKANKTITDPTIRQGLMKLHSFAEIGRFNNLRVKAAKEQGKEIPGMGNISKLSMSEMMRMQRDLGLRIVGASGMLHAYDVQGTSGDRRSHQQSLPRHRHRARPLRAGPADLRRHRPGAAQHHRRARARPAQGAEQRPHGELRRHAEERLRLGGYEPTSE